MVREAAKGIMRAQLDSSLGMLKGHRETLDRLSGGRLTKNRLNRSDVQRILTADSRLSMEAKR